MTTYPNPVSKAGVMKVNIQYDRPNEANETTVYLYDISGKLVYTHVQSGVEGITLNMSQIAVNPGIYVYQVRIKTANADHVSKAGKIIVTQ